MGDELSEKELFEYCNTLFDIYSGFFSKKYKFTEIRKKLDKDCVSHQSFYFLKLMIKEKCLLEENKEYKLNKKNLTSFIQNQDRYQKFKRLLSKLNGVTFVD